MPVPLYFACGAKLEQRVRSDDLLVGYLFLRLTVCQLLEHAGGTHHRLDRYLSKRVGIKRKDVRLLLAQGRVEIDGERARM